MGKDYLYDQLEYDLVQLMHIFIPCRRLTHTHLVVAITEQVLLLKLDVSQSKCSVISGIAIHKWLTWPESHGRIFLEFLGLVISLVDQEVREVSEAVGLISEYLLDLSKIEAWRPSWSCPGEVIILGRNVEE